MKFYYTLALLFFTSITFSQEFEMTGKVVDEEGTPLESATIYVEKVVDSSLVNYTISAKDGSFSLSGKSDDPKVAIFVSYAGYQPYRSALELTEEIDLETITMKVQHNELDEVLVTATRSPITLKKDTLEFNAASFTTRPDANLEELMKQLPGVEVDTEGNITVNGRPVSRFLVNGEEFFGSDHRIATKNLPKDIIDKIQVVDTKTEAQEFAGESGDPDNKTINITIQEDKNYGYFARATAGGGTDERYELSGIANYFKDEFRISALASSNNINSSGFSYDEVYGMMGRSAGRNVFGGGGGGITKSETAGVNFVNEWDDVLNFEETEFSGDYFFGKNDTESRTVLAREYTLPDSTNRFINSEDRNNLVNDSHRVNLEFEVEFDTLTRMSIRPGFNANYGNSLRSSLEETRNDDYNLENRNETFQNEDLIREDFSNRLDFTRRFGNRGAFLRLGLSNNHSRQDNESFLYTETLFYDEEEEERLQVQDQFIDEDEKSDRYSFDARQRAVLAEDFFMDLSYDFNYSNSTNKRYVYDSENGDGNYDVINNILSNDFEVTSTRHTPNLGLNYEGEVWRINTDFGLLHTNLKNDNFLHDIAFDNTFNNPSVRVNVRYELARSKSLSLRYDTNADIPNMRQLQPVLNQTNPVHMVQGNPSLRPAFRQSFNIDYRNFDFATRSGFSTWFNMNFTDNNVVSETRWLDDGVRYTTYTNVDGARAANLGGSYNKQIKNGRTEFRYNARLSGSYRRSIGFVSILQDPEPVKYEADSYSINPSIRFTYAIEELFDINPNYSLSYSSSDYSIEMNRDEEVINHRIGLQATSYWPENVIFGNDLSYSYFGQVAPGFDNTALLWNMSLGYQFLNDDATLKVQVYDLLDENVDTRRSLGDNYIQDTQSLILTRYAMLSFTYKFSEFGGGTGGRGPGGRGGRR